MKDIIPSIEKLVDQKEDFAIATVIKTWRSSPRPVGSSLVVTRDGSMIGSVSGGCVERNVLEKSLKLLESGIPEVTDYGVSNDDAWEVGLSCGGAISLHMDRFLAGRDSEYYSLWDKLSSAWKDNDSIALVSRLGGESEYFLVYEDGSTACNSEIEPGLVELLKSAIHSRSSQVLSWNDSNYFAHVFPRQMVMLMIGSAHITSELLSLAHMHDFETIIVDPRDTFASKTSYSDKPFEMHVKWPQEVLPDLNLDKDTYAVILSHDPKIDDEALNILLKSDVAYIGALGSKKTHEKRLARMKERGFSEEELNRIHAPIGLPIGALLPREIALSVMAEVIKVKNQ